MFAVLHTVDGTDYFDLILISFFSPYAIVLSAVNKYQHTHT
jgi:hypothetical protein